MAAPLICSSGKFLCFVSNGFEFIQNFMQICEAVRPFYMPRCTKKAFGVIGKHAFSLLLNFEIPSCCGRTLSSIDKSHIKGRRERQKRIFPAAFPIFISMSSLQQGKKEGSFCNERRKPGPTLESRSYCLVSNEDGRRRRSRRD